MTTTRMAMPRLGARAARASFAVMLASALLLSAFNLRADEGLTAALAGLRSESADERRAAAQAVESFGSSGNDAVTSIAKQLMDVERTGESRIPRLAVETRPGAGKDPDLVEMLVHERPEPSVTRALVTLCLMRALVRVGTTPAVRQLLRTAFQAGAQVRPELLRELKQLDDRATAALIEMRGDPSPEMRAWAKDSLETLGKRTPGDTVQTTSDPILVDVLHAYATVRDVDALPVVLSFVNSDRLPVRAAAREATLAYGADAVSKLRATYAALTGERLADTLDPAAVAQKLFDAYDRYRLRDVYALLDAGFAKERDGDLAGAIADFDNVLARQPILDRGKDMVAAYVAYAESIETADHVRARDYLRKALRLSMDDAGPGSDHIQSEMRFLDGADLMSQGIVDTAPFERALELDPSNVHARAQLNRLRADAMSRRNREGRIAAAVGTAGLSFLAVGLFALRLHRRRVGSRPR